MNWREVLIQTLQEHKGEITQEEFEAEVARIRIRLRGQANVYEEPSDLELQKLFEEIESMQGRSASCLMRYTKKAILNWIEMYCSHYDILSVTEELLGEKYQEWLIGKVIEVLREMSTEELEERFEGNENLTEMAIATIKEAKCEDIIKAALDGMGFDSKEAIFDRMSEDLGDES